MAVHLIQLLCPLRHAVLASAYECAGPADHQKAMTNFQALWLSCVDDGQLNPWCDICGSRDLRFEDGATPFRTLKEAEPFLMREQAKNLEAHERIGKDRWKRN